MRKIIVGALLGAVTLFVCSFIAHLPPVGTAGERTLPPRLLVAMHSAFHVGGWFAAGLVLARATAAPVGLR